MNIIKALQERKEHKHREIARPYVGDAVAEVTRHLTKYFADTRQVDLARLVDRLEYIRYDKPWPKGTKPEDAFDLAVQEALTIVREELRR
jgi:hypothetical protein